MNIGYYFVAFLYALAIFFWGINWAYKKGLNDGEVRHSRLMSDVFFPIREEE